MTALSHTIIARVPRTTGSFWREPTLRGGGGAAFVYPRYRCLAHRNCGSCTSSRVTSPRAPSPAEKAYHSPSQFTAPSPPPPPAPQNKIARGEKLKFTEPPPPPAKNKTKKMSTSCNYGSVTEMVQLSKRRGQRYHREIVRGMYRTNERSLDNALSDEDLTAPVAVSTDHHHLLQLQVLRRVRVSLTKARKARKGRRSERETSDT